MLLKHELTRLCKFGLVLVGGALSFAAASQPAAVSGDLNVSGFSLPDEIASVRIDTFKKTYPEINLNLPEGSLDAQQFLTAVASRNVPDVIYLSREDLSTYATRGAIEPLDECIETQGIDTSQYRTLAMNQVTLDGQVYGIPEFYSIIALILSDKAFADAGLSPKNFTTSNWDQLSQVNEQLTRDQNGKLTRIGFDPKLPEFFPLWVKANGSQLLSDDGRTAMLNTPEAVAALTYTLGLHDAAGGRQDFMAFRDTWDFFGADNELVADQLAAFPMEQWYFNVLAEASPDLKITVKAFSDRQGNPLTYASGNTWAIPRGAENPEAACAFMKTMTAPATWLAAAKARAEARAADNQIFTGVFTGNRVADQEIFSEVYEPSGNGPFDNAVKVALEVQDKAFATPSNPAGAEFKQAWTDGVNRALNGEQDPQAALDQAQREAQAALDDAWSR